MMLEENFLSILNSNSPKKLLLRWIKECVTVNLVFTGLKTFSAVIILTFVYHAMNPATTAPVLQNWNAIFVLGTLWLLILMMNRRSACQELMLISLILTTLPLRNALIIAVLVLLMY